MSPIREAIAEHTLAHEKRRQLQFFQGSQVDPAIIESLDFALKCARGKEENAWLSLNCEDPESIEDICALAIYLAMVMAYSKSQEGDLADYERAFKTLSDACVRLAGRPTAGGGT